MAMMGQMGQMGPPMNSPSGDIPFEAQALLMQPQAVEMFAPLEGFNLVSLFYFQLPFMLRKNELTTLQKNGQKLIAYTGTSLALGFIANIQIKRLYMNFLKWPIYARVPIRLGIMALPFIAFKSLFYEKIDSLVLLSNQITMRKNEL